jgi:hypothetical protein
MLLSTGIEASLMHKYNTVASSIFHLTITTRLLAYTHFPAFYFRRRVNEGVGGVL